MSSGACMNDETERLPANRAMRQFQPGSGASAPSGGPPIPETRASSRTGAGRANTGPPARLAAGPLLAVGAAVGLIVVAATDQILPATTAHQAETRIWLASRAAGFAALCLLTIQITLGLVLSHPTNKSTWRLSKRLFPWHENAWIFILAFLTAHVISLVVDPYAGVGLFGAFVPGLSSYRSAPVALGTLGLWALLATGATARYTRLLPPGAWLSIHRLSLVVFLLAWTHGLMAGTDSLSMLAFYLATGGIVLGAGAYRYWVSRAARPTFATSLEEGSHR
jgi:methionine sulfoxide reductase heme-binding subunit